MVTKEMDVQSDYHWLIKCEAASHSEERCPDSSLDFTEANTWLDLLVCCSPRTSLSLKMSKQRQSGAKYYSGQSEGAW